MRKVIVAAMLVFCAAGTATALEPADQEVLDQFKVFAAEEAERLKAKWEEIAARDMSPNPSLGIRMGWTAKFLYQSLKVESVPSSFGYDVRKTDSIVSPYRAYIEFPVVYVSAGTFVKGKKAFCHLKPITTCLENGGALFEWPPTYRSWARRTPKTLRHEYVFQEGKWTAPRSLEAAVAADLAAANLVSPLTPQQAPWLLGVPVPPAAPAERSE